MLFKFIVSETKPKTTAKLRQWEIAEISPGTPIAKNLKGLSNAEFSRIVACVRLLKVADTSKFGPHIKFEIFTLGTSFIHS